MISHIIPCLNQYEITKDLLDSLYRCTPSEFLGEVIIVDNFSNDDTAKVFDEYYIDMYIRNCKANMGFSRAINQGILLASKEYVCIWNNDMVPSPGWIQSLMAHINTPGFGMVTGQLIEPHEMGLENFKLSVDSIITDECITWAKGGPWLFKKNVFTTLGLFDERFFPTQYEDSDFLLRMAMMGIKHGMVTGSKIYHHSALTQNRELMVKDPTYPSVNRQRFVDKWGTADIDYERAYSRGEWYAL